MPSDYVALIEHERAPNYGLLELTREKDGWGMKVAQFDPQNPRSKRDALYRLRKWAKEHGFKIPAPKATPKSTEGIEAQLSILTAQHEALQERISQELDPWPALYEESAQLATAVDTLRWVLGYSPYAPDFPQPAGGD